MSIELFYDGLSAVLLADADLTAWAQNNFRQKLKLLDGNVPIETISPNEMPCLILEPQPAEGSPLGIGGKAIEEEGLIAWAVVWYETDRKKSMRQKLQLPTHVIQSILKQNNLNGNVAAAYCDSYEPDGGGSHPIYILRGTVTATYRITL